MLRFLFGFLLFVLGLALGAVVTYSKHEQIARFVAPKLARVRKLLAAAK